MGAGPYVQGLVVVRAAVKYDVVHLIKNEIFQLNMSYFS